MAELPAPVVATAAGRLRGGPCHVPGVARFYGIPYAAPPVGRLRWRPPQPVAPWRGVRDATRPSARCLQHAPYGEIEPASPGMSEDCLYLNVWTPAPAGHGRLPVLFWVHGGEFFAGSGTEARYDGARLAARGCVVVTINHRLGLFGFLAHPELSADSPSGMSGNFGLLDLLAGLEWVSDNIAAFGGDPAAVTLAGESAGSCVVSAFMAAPRAKGLFHRGIGQSCAYFMGEPHAMKPLHRRDNEALGVAFAQAAGAATLDGLRAMPGQRLLDIWLEHRLPRFQPQIGDDILPEPIEAVFARGAQAKVPLLAGWNGEETGYMRAAPARFDPAVYREAFTAAFGPPAEDIWADYHARAGGDAFEAMIALSSDRTMTLPTWWWIDAHARIAPVYAYRFDRAPPAIKSGPSHACEIEYVFGTLDSRALPWTEDDRILSDRIGALWTGFVREGAPHAVGTAGWTAYRPEAPAIMKLDTAPHMIALRELGRFKPLLALYEGRTARTMER